MNDAIIATGDIMAIGATDYKLGFLRQAASELIRASMRNEPTHYLDPP